MNNLRVIFCRSNPVDPDPRVEKEAVSLKEAGYPVTVIAWDRTGSLPEHDELEGLKVDRLPISAGYAQGLRNLPALLRWLLGLTLRLVRDRREYEIIHACDFDTIFPALLCKALFGKIVVYDIFDFYADHLRKTPGWVKRVIRWLDLRAVSWADGVILVDESRKEQLQEVQPARMAVINNSPRDCADQLAKRSPQRSSGLNLVYVGLLQVERGLLELMDLMARHPTYRLDLAGFGGDQDQILRRLEALDNVRWHGRINYQRTLELTAACDVSIATYDPEIPNHRFASPNKIFEAMMLAKPVIVARNTNMDVIIEEWNCGLVVPYGDLEALEDAVQRLKDDAPLCRSLGTNARKAYEEKYSWDIMERRLLDLYHKVQPLDSA